MSTRKGARWAHFRSVHKEGCSHRALVSTWQKWGVEHNQKLDGVGRLFCRHVQTQIFMAGAANQNAA